MILVARGEEKLVETKQEIEAAGGKCWMYTADVSDLASCDALVARVLKEHGTCHYLVNNAGRSIRRGVINSFDRFHDFERTMQLNYFGALRLIMGFLPTMIAQRQGHIINISSIGVLSNAPRFSAYVASKSALDSFSACAASEFLDKGINFTTINMPLVRTPMIAPTKMYENVPTLSPEEAADLVVEAIVYKPVRIATRLGIFGAMQPRRRAAAHADPAQHRVQHVPGLGGGAGQEGRGGGASRSSRPEQMAFAQLTQGIHLVKTSGGRRRAQRVDTLRLRMRFADFVATRRCTPAVAEQRVVRDAGEHDVLGPVEPRRRLRRDHRVVPRPQRHDRHARRVASALRERREIRAAGPHLARATRRSSATRACCPACGVPMVTSRRTCAPPYRRR